MFTWFRAQCADISFWKVVINAVYTKHVVSILYIHIYMYLKKKLACIGSTWHEAIGICLYRVGGKHMYTCGSTLWIETASWEP